MSTEPDIERPTEAVAEITGPDPNPWFFPDIPTTTEGASS